MSNLSTFLFARPSFMEGCARVLDMSGSLNTYHTSVTVGEADYWALVADWRAVGDDLQQAELAECAHISNLRGRDGQIAREAACQ